VGDYLGVYAWLFGHPRRGLAALPLFMWGVKVVFYGTR